MYMHCFCLDTVTVFIVVVFKIRMFIDCIGYCMPMTTHAVILILV